LSELDGKRQEYLFETVEEMQTFITCTDRSFFKRKNVKARFFFVDNGKVSIV
jgi:recombinational DNA repair ATPase RecF